MRVFLHLCIAALALAAPPSAHAQYTLAQLLALAEQRHADFLAQKAQYAGAQEVVPAARAVLLPQVGVQAQQGGSAMNGESWSAGINVSQTLLDLPRLQLLSAAKAQARAARHTFDAARTNLRRDVSLAWLAVQEAAAALNLADARRRALQEQKNRSEALAAAGQAIEADVLAARAELAGARAQWQQAMHNLAVAQDDLARYANADAADLPALILTGDVTRLSPPPLQEWLQTAGKKNPEQQAALESAAAARRQLRAATAALVPIISLSGGVTSQDGLDNENSSWELSLRHSLFTSGTLTSERRRLMAQNTAAHQAVAAARRRNAHTLSRLHGQLQADGARIAALTEAAAAAAALLQVVTFGYENGVNLITDVLSAEENAFDARLALQTASYGYLKNWVTAQALLAQLDGDGGDADFARQLENLFAPAGG